MIVDEAHRLKNEHSQLSEVLRTLSSKYRLLLTGTPLQNNLHELWALLNFLLPETFDSSAEFDEVFNAEEKQIKDGILTMLHRILRPFMLRRLKSDVEKALPPKIETLVFVGMSQKQKELYLSVLNKDHDAVLGNTKEKARLLNILMQLRKAANHPYLFDGVEDRSIPAHDCEHLIQMSGKVAVLDKLLAKLKAAGSRVLIFSQMTRMLDILEDYLIYRGYEYCRIDGNTGTQARDEAMEIFNAPNSPKFCFLLSTRSGGLGINLATADVVILFDSDWNPQMDLQAQDRAHRIGQKKQVRVYRLITESTVEEKIIERAEIKLRLDALVIQQGRLSSKSQKLNQKDVQEMIQYGADKIFRSKESAITDEDIDLILSRGEAKTVEFNDKLQKHVGLLSLGSQGAGSAAGAGGSGGLSAGSGGVGLVLDGSDNGPLLPVDENARERKFDLLLKISEAIPKQRERKKRLNYSTEDYFRAAMSAAKPVRTNVLKVPRLPKMLDFQFYNEARLRELYEKEREFYETYQDDPDPPATSGLTKEEQDERDKLEAEAYGEWNRRHYQAYIRACERFGRDNIEKISQNVMGKTAQEVIAYHKVFWSRYKQLRGWERIIRSIERSELRKERNKAVEQLIAKKLSKYPNLEVAMTRVSFKYNTKNNPAAKGYTPENDAFFLCGVSREGYGEWDAMRQAIRDTPELRFDYFMQSRSALEVHRRVDTLVRILEKEAEEDAAAAEEKKGGDAAASGMGPSATVGAAAASAVGSAMGAKGKAAGGKKPAAAARRAGKRPPEASAPPKSPRSPKRPKLATTPAGGGGAEQAQGQDANAERNYSDSVSHSLALESGSHS
jgi:SWI/SNF-related matrix-associated actin-dependent regulator of chromatin subfamily A member 5